MTVTPEAARGFRLGRQGLVEPASDLVAVATAVAMRNSPPGSASISLHARVAGAAVGTLERALADKELVELWSLRASPCLVAPADLPVFTAGVLPDDEASLRHFLQGFGRAAVDMATALDRATAAVCEALDGRVLSKSELSSAVTKLVPEALAPWCPQCNVPHISESLLRAVGLRGVFCFVPRAGVGASLVRLDQWLGYSPVEVDVAAARAELVRRYLRWYGPSSARHFAAWAGISTAQGRRWWARVEDELVPVDGGDALLADDVDALRDPPVPLGVRLLPPADPYLLHPDREALLPDKEQQKVLWRAIGSPGAVLSDGEIVAAWRSQKKGSQLSVSVEPFSAGVPRSAVEEAVEALAAHRGCTEAGVDFA